MLKPKVSILMACYNGERFIDRSFNSILAQTWPNIELIFVDDGSTDNSFQKAQSYINRFVRRNYCLRIFHQDNLGAASAVFNASLKASGKYLQILDVDDMIMPDSCCLQAEFLELNPHCNVVRTNGYIVSEDNITSQERLIELNAKSINSNIFIDLITGDANNWAGAYMVRADLHRRFYDSHVFPISRYGQNLQFILPQVVNSPSGFIDKPLFKYVRHLGSHSNQQNYEKQMENLQGYWDIRRKMLKILSISDKKILDICEISYLRRAFQIALDFQKNNDAFFYYSNLKKRRGLSVDIKYQMACCRHTVMRYWYRLNMIISSIYR